MPPSNDKYGIHIEVGNPLPVGTQEQRVTSFLQVIDLKYWDFFPSSQPLVTPHVFSFTTSNKELHNKMKRLVENFQSRTAMAFTGVSFKSGSSQGQKNDNHGIKHPQKKKKNAIQSVITLDTPDKGKKLNKGRGSKTVHYSIHVEIGHPHPATVCLANFNSFRDTIIEEQRIPSKWSFNSTPLPDDPYTLDFKTTDKGEYAFMKKFVQDCQTEGCPAFFTSVTFTSGNRVSIMKEKMKPLARKIRKEGFYSVATRAKYMERFYIKHDKDMKRHGPIRMFKEPWTEELELYESLVGPCWLPIGGGLFFTGEMIISQHDLYINGREHIDTPDASHPLHDEIMNWKENPNWPRYLPPLQGYEEWYRELPISWDFLWEEEVERIAPKDEQPFWPFLEVEYVCEPSDDDDDEDNISSGDEGTDGSLSGSEYEFDG